MESGRSSEVEEKVNTQKGSATSFEGNRNKNKNKNKNNIEPFIARGDHNPRELRSWAKRTGFVSYFSSGEVVRSSGTEKDESDGFDLEKKPGSSSPKIEIDPILGRTRNRIAELEPNLRHGGRTRKSENEVQPIVGGKDEEERRNGLSNGKGVSASNVTTDTQVMERKKEYGNIEREEIGIDMHLDGGGEEPVNGGGNQSLRLKCGLRENPGFVPLIYYGMQHYFSLAGSLIFIPLIIVPAMGGTDRDTATVISTIMLVTGVTTILHSYFGTRLPLVQGSSFVYLAPALVIINAREYRNLTEHKFRHIMRELQGAIIVGSIFQFILGFSGLMSFFLRLINPVVVAPTVAAVGLAFFSYAFPQAGNCVAISVPQILLVLIFALYLRGLSVYGHRIFQIYAVPLSGLIIWAYASFLTAGGAYNYKGCSPDIPSSNILIDSCKKHAYTMKYCRTDVSDAWRTADWVRIPYPLQWGIPIFRLRTSIIMTIVTLVASVDSVGAYHSASVRINSKPPTPGTVSRGIGLEGFCSVLAGLWGTGTGSTTLTENVHTIGITKVASRRAVVLGSAFLVVFSFVGKVGAILASIPQALAAALLCFVWALIVALGLLTLQYTHTASFRNIMIVGVSLFFGLSIPSYFQQYQPESTLILPGYFIPYSAASAGPIRSGNNQFDFAMNALLSMNMVVTFLVAIVLDNTVPGNQQERGVYRWSSAEDLTADPSILADYSLPGKISRFFHWPRCLGA